MRPYSSARAHCRATALGDPLSPFLPGPFCVRGSVFLAPRLTGRWTDSRRPRAHRDLAAHSEAGRGNRNVMEVAHPCGSGVNRKELALKMFVRSLGEIPHRRRRAEALPPPLRPSSWASPTCERSEPMPIYPQRRTTSAGLPALQRMCHILALAPAKGCETRGPNELTEPSDGCW